MSEKNIRDILKEGDIIRTRHCQAYNWVTNIILGMDEKCIEVDIGIEQEYLENIVEIQYFEESKNQDGKLSLRFPVFKKLRTDKTEPSYN